MAYVNLGADNGGILLDVSEAGLSFQGIVHLSAGQILPVDFKLPGTNISIQAKGRLAHRDNSEKSGGLRLLNLPPEAQLQLREWVAQGERAEEPASDYCHLLPGPSGLATETEDLVSSPATKPEKDSAEVSPPAAPDGPTRLISVLAKALAQSAATEPDSTTNENVRADRSKREEPGGVAAKSAAAKPELPAAPPSFGPRESQKPQSTRAGGQAVPAISELKVSASFPAATESKKTVREAVVQSSVIKKRRAAKGSRIAQFAAGLAVGGLAFAAIAGGLLATGRLRLNRSSFLPSSASAELSTNTTQVGNLALGEQQASTEIPSVKATVPAPQQFQVPETTPPRPAPTSTRAAVPATPRSVAGTAKPATNHTADPSSATKIAQNRPAAGTNASPGRANVRAPSLSEGMTTPLPELEARAPAPVMQTAAPVAQSTVSPPAVFPAREPEAVQQPKEQKPAPVTQPVVSITQSTALPAATFAAPEPEVQQPRQRKPAAVSPASGSVFSSPEPEGSRPSSTEPVKLVLHADPVYPQEARATNVQGSVDVLAMIGKDGVPRDLRATRGDSHLAAAAIAAISQWRYRPAMLNGQPEESLITITVTFTP